MKLDFILFESCPGSMMLGGWTETLRNKTWHIRVYVPKAFQAVVGKKEITRSLGTGSHREAKQKAPAVYCRIEREVAEKLGGVQQPYIDGAASYFDARAPQIMDVPHLISLESLIQKYNDNRSQRWAPKTLVSYEQKQREIISYFGKDFDIRNLTPEMCIQFRNDLARLPPNYRKIKGNERVGLRKLAASYKAEVASRTLHASSVNKMLDHLMSLLSWAHAQGWVQRYPGALVDSLDTKKKDGARRPMTCEEINRIFAARELKEGDRGESRFWICAIALFSGMRISEICQLGSRDIVAVAEFWVFLVQETPVEELERRLKSSAATRKIPIHPELIKLGFLDYVASRESSELLFPDAVSHSTKLGVLFGEKYSKSINRMFREIGIMDKGVVFHSFRHNFRDATRWAELPRDAVAQLGGWSQGSDMVDHYGSQYGLAQLYAFISKVKYEGLVIEKRTFESGAIVGGIG